MCYIRKEVLFSAAMIHHPTFMLRTSVRRDATLLSFLAVGCYGVLQWKGYDTSFYCFVLVSGETWLYCLFLVAGGAGRLRAVSGDDRGQNDFLQQCLQPVFRNRELSRQRKFCRRCGSQTLLFP